MGEIYVVYLTEYIGDKLPRFYIGSTSKSRIENGYNGTVASKKYKSLYKDEQKNNKHLFKTEILYECYTREVALDIEYKYQKYVDCVHRDDYMNMSYAGGKFGLNLVTKESIEKGIETKRKNGVLGCTKETSKKIIEIKRKNGTLQHKISTIEKYKKSMTKQDGSWNNNTEKRLNTVMTIDESGTTIAKRGGMKMKKTRLNRLNQEGLNDFENMKITQKNYMNSVDENGIRNADRIGKKVSYTKIKNNSSKGSRNSMAKKILIFDRNGVLQYTCKGNFKEVCNENNLPFSALRKSYANKNNGIYLNKKPINNKYSHFIGWYAKEIQNVD